MHIRNYIKTLSLALTFLIFLQSCTVYHSTGATIEDAVNSKNKVKIKSPESEVYKFLSISYHDDKLYGLTSKKSSTAKKLSAQIATEEKNQKHVNILLDEDDISSLHLKNKTGSTVATIAVPVVIVGALAGIAYIAADNMTIAINLSE